MQIYNAYIQIHTHTCVYNIDHYHLLDVKGTHPPQGVVHDVRTIEFPTLPLIRSFVDGLDRSPH